MILIKDEEKYFHIILISKYIVSEYLHINIGQLFRSSYQNIFIDILKNNLLQTLDFNDRTLQKVY